MSNSKSKPSKYVHGCLASYCNNKYFHPVTDPEYTNKKFFRFPDKDLKRRHDWFEIIGIEFTETRCYLCEDHFEETQFTSSLKTKLLNNAVPSKIIHISNVHDQLLPIPAHSSDEISVSNVHIFSNKEIVPPKLSSINNPVKNKRSISSQHDNEYSITPNLDLNT